MYGACREGEGVEASVIHPMIEFAFLAFNVYVFLEIQFTINDHSEVSWFLSMKTTTDIIFLYTLDRLGLFTDFP